MRVGILGGGQLAQMLTQAAISLGIDTAIYERTPDSPAARLTQVHAVGEWDDIPALTRFAESCDVLTLENEFIYAASLAALEARDFKVYPTSRTLGTIQDKLLQKQAYDARGLPVPAFAAVSHPDEIAPFAREHGWPLVLKARYGGYDGYGNATLHGPQDIAAAWDKLTQRGAALMVEAWAAFQMELAVMVLRGHDGTVSAYPVVETVQQNHICHVVRAPAAIPEDVRARASALAIEAVQALDGVGVFGVELFLMPSGGVLLNECAPRPHNSGHYTIEGCVTSQFENHLRAVLGLPLGSVTMTAPAAVMVNVLGRRSGPATLDSLRAALTVNGAHVHLYGKRESRIGRKMGHITALADTVEHAELIARQAADLLDL